ncbi:MAG: T9SS type A sorting domain-containing protein [bacterium]|nr:T9SS type A sorting domain-containing protein [bacterium]
MEVFALEDLYWASDVKIVGQYAFVAGMDNGIFVVDISNPTAPFVTGRYDTPGYATRVLPVGTTLYVADDDYFSIYDISAALSTPDNTNPIVTTFSLHPIYPNPFNNTANIAFDLPREVTGRLVVYDVLGRMTNTLYNGKLAAGSHQMQFNGNNLSTGIYFVRLETSAFTATQKAVLLK